MSFFFCNHGWSVFTSSRFFYTRRNQWHCKILSKVPLNKENADKVLKLAVKMMLSCKREEEEMFASSVMYLQLDSVKQQLHSRIDEFHLQSTSVKIGIMLGCGFMEWKAVDMDGKEWELNFWPCSSCACISCLPVEKETWSFFLNKNSLRNGDFIKVKKIV